MLVGVSAGFSVSFLTLEIAFSLIARSFFNFYRGASNLGFLGVFYFWLARFCLAFRFNVGFVSILVDLSLLYFVVLAFAKSFFFQSRGFVDLTAIDWLGFSDFRFEVIYQLLSFRFNFRIEVRAFLDACTTVLVSVTSFFAGAGWYEREIFDMFGIRLVGHPCLRRILTDYGFVGFPLRKDFPVVGYSEVFFSFSFGRVVYRNIELSQVFRGFVFSAWDIGDSTVSISLSS